MDFEGTFFVGHHEPLDNDFIGFIFSFQDSSNFYLLMSARDDSGLVNCQVGQKLAEKLLPGHKVKKVLSYFDSSIFVGKKFLNL